jgi:hypothetical protein
MTKRHGLIAILAAVALTLSASNLGGSVGAHAAHEAGADTRARKIGTQTPSKNSRADRPERKTHRAVNQRKVAEASGYKKLSSLVNFPAFFPGLGIIYVKPDTLPEGPFLCFDRKDHLVATVYMIPVQDIDDHKKFELAGFGGKDDHVSLYFNGGHPGADMPHYHVVIWHVSRKDEARVAK